MRLKQNYRVPEERFLLQNHELNKRYEEHLIAQRSRAAKKPPSENLLLHHLWQGSKDPEHSVSPRGYSPSLASPLADCDQAMSLSSPEEEEGPVLGESAEDSNLSDTEYTESSPLLKAFPTSVDSTPLPEDETYDSGSEDSNNNSSSSSSSSTGNDPDSESEDSLFSDCSDMSEHVTDCLLENHFTTQNNNNNFLDDVTTTAPPSTTDLGTYFPTQKRSFPIRASTEDINTCDFVNETAIAFENSPPISTGFANILSLNVGHSPTSSGGEFNDISPMSDTSSSSELNINMAMETLNDFSTLRSKQSDIKCLVLDKERKTDANIREMHVAGDAGMETKILNTMERLPKNMTREHKLKIELDENVTWDSRHYPKEKASVEIENGNVSEESVPKTELLPPLKIIEKNCCPVGRDPAPITASYSANICKEILDFQNTSKKKIIQLEQVEKNDMKEKQVESPSSSIADLLKILDKPPANMTVGVKKDVPSEDSPTSVPEQVWNLIPEPLNKGLPVSSVLNVSSGKPVSRDGVSARRTDEQSANKHSLASAGTNGKALLRKTSPELFGDFDVYNIETTMPTIDWDAMEAHLTRAAKEADWLARRRNDREEIRRKLAMDTDSEDYYCGERVTRKPSLTTRLQSGMNLQICFMNETASDQESQGSDQDTDSSSSGVTSKSGHNSVESEDILGGDTPVKDLLESKENGISSQEQVNNNVQLMSKPASKQQRPSFFFNRQRSWRLGQLRPSKDKDGTLDKKDMPEEDFITRQARLRAEARLALAQAKEMARMQMEVERQRKKKSPIAEIVGIPFPDGRHRLSRQILTDMNVAQLQVIVNDLHSQIESLNEDLVRLLLERDDLHMEQDSMLVDIEDLTRFLGAKDAALRKQHPLCTKIKSSSK